MSVVQKWGDGLGVRVPEALSEQLGLHDGSEIEMTLRDGAIVISPVRRTYELADLLAGCKPENRPLPVDWSLDVGGEFL